METINKMQKLWKSWKFGKSTIKIKVDSMTNPQILSTGSILERRILVAFCVHSKSLKIFGVAKTRNKCYITWKLLYPERCSVMSIDTATNVFLSGTR